MYSNDNILILAALLNVVLFTISAKEAEIFSEALHRSRRQLLFLNNTVLQFNAGFGFPSAARSINVNWLFQANFVLPWNRTQIPVDILYANSGYTGPSRKKREMGIKDDENGDYQDAAQLYHFYKNIEYFLDSFGYKGQPCVLQTLCQLGAEPLHSDDEEDLLHEISAFVLNPLNDATNGLSEGDEAYSYIKAYTDGQKHQDCTSLYQGCSRSFIDLFTKLHVP